MKLLTRNWKKNRRKEGRVGAIRHQGLVDIAARLARSGRPSGVRLRSDPILPLHGFGFRSGPAKRRPMASPIRSNQCTDRPQTTPRCNVRGEANRIGNKESKNGRTEGGGGIDLAGWPIQSPDRRGGGSRSNRPLAGGAFRSGGTEGAGPVGIGRFIYGCRRRLGLGGGF